MSSYSLKRTGAERLRLALGIAAVHQWLRTEERRMTQRNLFVVAMIIASSVVHADQWEDDRLRRSQQEALDNYNHQADMQRQSQTRELLLKARQIRQQEEVPAKLETGRDFIVLADRKDPAALGYAVAIVQVGMNEKVVCPAGYIEYGDVRDAAYSYIKEHPALLDKTALYSVEAAMVAKWGCPKQ